MKPILLSGGSGSRLWPVSRSKFPKQFAPIGGKSLQDRTLERLSVFGCPIVVSSISVKNLNEASVKKINYDTAPGSSSQPLCLYEPQRKNTAAAICWALRELELRGQTDAVVGIFPSDQFVANEHVFIDALKKAEAFAKNNPLTVITIGISPTYPATGFGYIQLDTQPDVKIPGNEVIGALGFREKPDPGTAQSFIEAKTFVWNAGIFVGSVGGLIEKIKSHAPDVWRPFAQSLQPTQEINAIFEKVPSISFDYAVMEKLNPGADLFCVPTDCGWDDVGSWDALQKYTDFQLVDQRYRHQRNCQDVALFSDLKKHYAFNGVNDLIVVDTQDALMITRRGESEGVKAIVEEIQKSPESNVTAEHVFEDRPWGRYEVLQNQQHFKSKVIDVLPMQQLSYQSHAKREEHWLITQGLGEVVLNDEVIKVKAGSYVFIPLGAKHRMRNTHPSQNLQFIEVQLGEYFGEDDIQRYQDDYQRS